MSWDVDLAQAINPKKYFGGDISIGVIFSVTPLKVIIKGAKIEKNLYVNPEILSSTKSPLKPGDTVIVLERETSFYIIAKVVQL